MESGLTVVLQMCICPPNKNVHDHVGDTVWLTIGIQCFSTLLQQPLQEDLRKTYTLMSWKRKEMIKRKQTNFSLHISKLFVMCIQRMHWNIPQKWYQYQTVKQKMTGKMIHLYLYKHKMWVLFPAVSSKFIPSNANIINMKLWQSK